MSLQSKQILIKTLQSFTLEELLAKEQSDLQYKSLTKLFSNYNVNPFSIENTFLFSLITLNSLICYQLSKTWEFYRNEFCEFLIVNKDFILKINTIEDLIDMMFSFLNNTKGNKRLKDIKIKRFFNKNLLIFNKNKK